ncbi:hypothetical protein BVY02_00685 [bacterium J17]|nr:hypothetical protein BVY02_00685 [bacterium J17]
MEQQTRYAFVGGVVVALMVGMVATILWLSEAGSLRKASYYAIYFENQTLDGLRVESVVTMKGIKVGNVAKLHVAPQNIEQVRVVIRVEEQTPVKESTRALIQRNLLTGLATIDLAGGTQASPFRTKIPKGEKYPVIPEGKSSLDTIADSLPALVDDVGATVDKIRNIVSDENVQSFRNIVTNIEMFTDTFSEKREVLERTIVKLDRLTDEALEVSSSIKGFASRTGNTFDKVASDLAETVEELNLAATNLSEQFEEVTVAVKSAARVIVHEVGGIGQSIRTASQSVARTAEGYEDPQKILSGPSEGALGPGEEPE